MRCIARSWKMTTKSAGVVSRATSRHRKAPKDRRSHRPTAAITRAETLLATSLREARTHDTETRKLYNNDGQPSMYNKSHSQPRPSGRGLLRMCNFNVHYK